MDEMPKEEIQFVLNNKINGKRERNCSKDSNSMEIGIPSKRVRIEN